MKTKILVLDIGKTNAKLCALDTHGDVLEVVKKLNTPIQTGQFIHADVEGIWGWLCEGVQTLASHHHFEYFAITTHGATAVCLSQGELAFPVLDYEDSQYEAVSEAYAAVRPAFAESYSPKLKGGLNIGQQLYWLEQNYPDKFAKVDAILMYPQYWAWRLCGVAASEVTSLGCHTDLWAPDKKQFSSMVEKLGWLPRFPEVKPSGSILGTVKPELAKALGLPESCQVVNGLHDSNASLVPYLKQADRLFTVISTGTWTIMANIGGDTSLLDEHKDMLANVNAYGSPVPCIRFMGGREWEVLREAPDSSQPDLTSVLEKGLYVLPSFADAGGPFQRFEGKIMGDMASLSATEKTALASLYCALMTDYCLDALASHGDIFIEGSFTQNEVYQQALQLLRPNQRVRISDDSTGTLSGSVAIAQSLRSDITPHTHTLTPWFSLSNALLQYKQNWRALIPML